VKGQLNCNFEHPDFWNQAEVRAALEAAGFTFTNFEVVQELSQPPIPEKGFMIVDVYRSLSPSFLQRFCRCVIHSVMTKPATLYLLLILAAIASFTACVVPLSQQAGNVVETTEPLVVDCKFLSLIKPNSLFGIGEESIRNGLRARAAELAATHIVYKRTPSDSVRVAYIYNCVDREFASENTNRSRPPAQDWRNPPDSAGGSHAPVDNSYRRY